MAAQIIDGKALASNLRKSLAKAVRGLPGQPCLAVILVGDNPASQVYVRSKVRLTEEAGMKSIYHQMDSTTTQGDLEYVLDMLNRDEAIDGILLQLPLPEGLNQDAAIAKISPQKDVDGLTELNAGYLFLGKPGLTACTPTGCVMLAKHALGEDLTGQHVVIIGRSILVGKPAALLFLAENCTVTIAHSRTANLQEVCRKADILVPAVGLPHLVKADWVKPGACIIDVGINRIEAPEKGEGKTRLVGDADYENCATKAGHITPVPGGVGPMTIACLLRNTVIAACRRRGWTVPDNI